MQKILCLILMAISWPSFSEDITRCNLNYYGDPDKFISREMGVAGIHTDVFTYDCRDCGGIQLTSFPSSQSMKAYNFISATDFIKKISSTYSQNDIAKLEMSELSAGGKRRFNISDTGIADFYPGGEKITYLHFSANLTESGNGIPVGYIGFVSSSGHNSCTVIASFGESELTPEGRETLSYFMNHISFM